MGSSSRCKHLRNDRVNDGHMLVPKRQVVYVARCGLIYEDIEKRTDWHIALRLIVDAMFIVIAQSVLTPVLPPRNCTDGLGNIHCNNNGKTMELQAMDSIRPWRLFRRKR